MLGDAAGCKYRAEPGCWELLGTTLGVPRLLPVWGGLGHPHPRAQPVPPIPGASQGEQPSGDPPCLACWGTSGAG